MPYRARGKQPAVYNTPTIRNGGFGYLQVEAIQNRPMSIARRHLAASELRMRGIEPNELSSSEWVRFLVMDTTERERWLVGFERRRRNSNESTTSNESSASVEGEAETDAARAKAEEAKWEAEEAARNERRRELAEAESSSVAATIAAAAAVTPSGAGRTPSVTFWARQFDDPSDGGQYSARRPRHERCAVTEGVLGIPPPTYQAAVRSSTPPPAYEPRSDDEGSTSPRHVRFAV